MGAYLSHVYFWDNRATENTHRFLLRRASIPSRYHEGIVEDPKPKPPQIIEGVSQKHSCNTPMIPNTKFSDTQTKEGQRAPFSS